MSIKFIHYFIKKSQLLNIINEFNKKEEKKISSNFNIFISHLESIL
ncbi:hypothetical protein HMPREF9094_0226 [Fusobacterium animalis ATCC 51191]|uniref:Uncharacterized protein n=1 Tax=Fusobacterium animalis ATCC 51191 TaxID=997347 RepID=F9EJX2_9FUSO|nr:hypothetical protein HMPREF9094_0226 [Fusobacterium animalis ATCC 51191]